MKRILLLILIAIITFLLVALFQNIDLLKNIWLWLIGLAGVIIRAGKGIFEYVKSLFDKPESAEFESKKDSAGLEKSISASGSPPAILLDPSRIQMSLLRFHDDGHTTLGLLYINNKFYCYTLEDTYHEIKIANETRIPAGFYTVDFCKEETDLTLKYRQQYSEWFNYHLEIKNVPDFHGIYLHNGGTNKDTAGCVLVSDSFNVSKNQTVLTNSKNTFETMYKFLTKHLTSGKKIIISIKNEDWINNLSE